MINLVEEFRRKPEKPEKKGPERKPTLSDITRTERGRKLFLELVSVEANLRGLEADEIIERLERGKTTKEDREFLSQMVDEFDKRMEEVRKAGEILRPETLDRIIVQDPGLQRLARLIGRESLKRALAGKLEEIAVSQPEHFDQLMKRLFRLSELLESERQWNDRLQEEMERRGIDPKKYGAQIMSILRIDDPQKRLIELKKAIAQVKGWGWLKRVLFSGNLEKIALTLDQRSDLERFARTLESAEKKVGEILSILTNENPVLVAVVNEQIRTMFRSEAAPVEKRGEQAMRRLGRLAEQLPKNLSTLVNDFENWAKGQEERRWQTIKDGLRVGGERAERARQALLLLIQKFLETKKEKGGEYQECLEIVTITGLEHLIFEAITKRQH